MSVLVCGVVDVCIGLWGCEEGLVGVDAEGVGLVCEVCVEALLVVGDGDFVVVDGMAVWFVEEGREDSAFQGGVGVVPFDVEEAVEA
jgi:hypothetical protein